MLCLSGMDSQRIANTAALQMVHVGIWHVLRPQKGFPDKHFRAKVYTAQLHGPFGYQRKEKEEQQRACKHFLEVIGCY